MKAVLAIVAAAGLAGCVAYNPYAYQVPYSYPSVYAADGTDVTSTAYTSLPAYPYRYTYPYAYPYAYSYPYPYAYSPYGTLLSLLYPWSFSLGLSYGWWGGGHKHGHSHRHGGTAGTGAKAVTAADGVAERPAWRWRGEFGARLHGSVKSPAGDKGQFASAEIQTPNWCPATAAIAVQCRALAFVDAAGVSRNKALPGEEQRTSISSAGLGLRFALDRLSSLHVDYGRVLDGGGSRAAGDSRVHVALFLSY